jgi:hypothetical protein
MQQKLIICMCVCVCVCVHIYVYICNSFQEKITIILV